VFRPLTFAESDPAVGQGAIALQCRAGDEGKFAPALDAATARCVNLERAFQARVGAGCQIAFAAHAENRTLHFYHESTGIRTLPLDDADFAAPVEAAARILKELGFR
jgi:hydroxymethylbilane synthase